MTTVEQVNDDPFWDQAAEMLVIAAALDNPHLVDVVAGLDPDVFYLPTTREIHTVIRSLQLDGEPVDHVAVARRAAARASGTATGRAVEQAVLQLMGKAAGAVIGFHVDRLNMLRQARAVQETAVRLQQHVGHAVRADDPETMARGLETTLDTLAMLRNVDAGVLSDSDLPPSLDDILDTPDAYSWLVPGLLERTDRMILTGFEGTGKSYLLAQIALCVAAGLNPFLGFESGQHSRVLVIDCENSERQTARRYRRIRDAVSELCVRQSLVVPDWSKQVRFVIRPEGMELNDPRVVQRIERNIRATDPDLVVIGPLYRLHKLDTRDEQAAKEITDVLDALRIRHQFALIAEAHVAHGTREARALRPTGSSLFLRWPEFGVGLRPTNGEFEGPRPTKVDLVHWRGGREDRCWPSTLEHNYRGLPWLADEKYWLKLEQAGVQTGGVLT